MTSKKKWFLFWLGLIVVGAACGANADQSLKPDASVSAATPPVKLTLQVYRTRLKLQMRKRGTYEEEQQRAKEQPWGGPLWVKIGITNVGKKEIVIGDDLFTGLRDFQDAIAYAINGGPDIRLEVVRADGKPVPLERTKDNPAQPFEPIGPMLVSDKNSDESRRTDALVQGWKKAGYSNEKIDELLAQDTRAHAMTLDEFEQRQFPSKILKPGRSLWTGAYVHHGWQWPEQAPVGDYAELLGFDLNKPGIYKIRAVYDRVPGAKMIKLFKERGLKFSEEEVRVKTPWIKLEVKQ